MDYYDSEMESDSQTIILDESAYYKSLEERRLLDILVSINQGTNIKREDDHLPNYDDVLDAVVNLKGVTHRTQVLTSKTINEKLGARLNNGQGGKLEVFFKCENMQKCGSFKSRGAYNAISNLSPDQ